MKRQFAAIAAIGILLVLAGCAGNPAQPRYVEGHYYMVGDVNCLKGRQLTPTRVMCMDKNGVDTGYRDAMTDQELQMYQLERMQAQANRAELNEQLRQTGQMFQQAGQQTLQQSQSYGMPQVQGIPNLPSTTTYNQVGNTLIGTDGTSCQTVGQSVICR